MISHLLISKTAQKVLHKLESKPSPSRPADGSPACGHALSRHTLRAHLLPPAAAASPHPGRGESCSRKKRSRQAGGLLCFHRRFSGAVGAQGPGPGAPARLPASPLPGQRPVPAGNSYRTLFLSRYDKLHGPYILVGDCICFTRV